MASPLGTGKQSVNLARSNAPRGAPGSRIRRDPPPVVKQLAVIDPEERDRRMVIVGVVTFAVAILVVTLALGNAGGWSLANYTYQMR